MVSKEPDAFKDGQFTATENGGTANHTAIEWSRGQVNDRVPLM